MDAPELASKVSVESVLALLAAAGGMLGWVFKIGQRTSRMEVRIDQLEARDKEHDAQLAKIETSISSGLERIEGTHERAVDRLEARFMNLFKITIPNQSQGGG